MAASAQTDLAGVALGWEAEVCLEAEVLVEARRPFNVADVDHGKGSLWHAASSGGFTGPEQSTAGEPCGVKPPMWVPAAWFSAAERRAPLEIVEKSSRVFPPAP
jgi:hypothetical protein